MLIELEVVLNCKYGGFSIDSEMALWLMENRNWTVVKDSVYDYKSKNEFPTTCLVEGIGDWFHHAKYSFNSIEFRSNRDLIDCVKAIKDIHKNDKYPDSYYAHIHSLEVVKVGVLAEIEDYDDGHERITCQVIEN